MTRELTPVEAKASNAFAGYIVRKVTENLDTKSHILQVRLCAHEILVEVELRCGG